MAIQLLSTPEVNGSRWNAAHNHVTFLFDRQDYLCSSVTDLGGFCRVFQLNSGTANDSNVIVGARVTLNALPYYDRVVGKITAVSGTWFFDTDIPFVNTITSGWFNLSTRINYSLAIELENVVTGLKRVGLYSADPTGKIRADIAAFALNELYLTELLDYSQVNTIDVGKSVEYRITYTDAWGNQDGSQQSGTPVTLPDTYQITKSARQLRSVNGSNMIDFLLKSVNPALFLSEFETPSAWEGYPFSLSFIYDFPDGVVLDGILKRHVDQYDVNGVLLGVSKASILYSFEGFVNLLTFKLLDIEDKTEFVELYIEDDDTPAPDEGYFLTDLFPSYALGGYVVGNV